MSFELCEWQQVALAVAAISVGYLVAIRVSSDDDDPDSTGFENVQPSPSPRAPQPPEASRPRVSLSDKIAGAALLVSLTSLVLNQAP